jgi:hypothetical protein
MTATLSAYAVGIPRQTPGNFRSLQDRMRATLIATHEPIMASFEAKQKGVEGAIKRSPVITPLPHPSVYQGDFIARGQPRSSKINFLQLSFRYAS